MNTKQTCLIIDDSEIICEIAERIILDLGLDAKQALNSANGIELCKQHMPDVVLLDWDLPSMGALDFLRGVAETQSDKKPEIILCATENDPQQFTLAKAAGAAHYILKPFDKTVIAEKLSEIGVIAMDRQTDDHAKQAANE